MADNYPKVAELFFVGEKLHSNHCIWCGDEPPLTESHLFPKVIGGAFAPVISCSLCNNFLGRTVEKEIKKNVFLTAAIAKLGLQDKREAFRHAKKVDPQTGAEVHFTKKGLVKPVPKPHGNDGFIGLPEDTKSFGIRMFKQSRPNWSTKPIEEFYDDPHRTSITHAGIKFTKKTFEGGPAEIRLEGLSRDPHPQLVFKIAYEFISILGLRGVAIIEEALKDLVIVDKNKPYRRLSVSSAVNWRTMSNTSNSFREFRQLDDVPFRPVHYAVFRLSRNLNLYLEVGLFHVLRNFFILGQMQHFDELIMPLVDMVVLFPIGESAPRQQRYRNLLQPINVQWPDAAVDSQVYAIETAREKRNR